MHLDPHGRVYVRTRSSQHSRLAAVALFGLIGLGMVVGSLLASKPGTHPEVLRYIAAPFLVLAALIYWEHRRFLLVLSLDRMRIRSLRDRTILRSDITGYRLGDTHQVMDLFGSKGRIARLGLSFELDDEFRQWFADAVDLDQQDFNDALEAVRLAAPTAPSREDFAVKFSKQRRLDAWLGLGICCPLLVLALYPRPYLPLVLFGMLTPPVLMVTCLARPTRVRFRTIPGWPGADVPVLVASIALGARAFASTSPLDLPRVALGAAPVVLLFTAGIYIVTDKEKLKTALAASSLAAAYAYGFIALGNQVFDPGPPLAAKLDVLEKKLTRGSHDSCSIVGPHLLDARRRHRYSTSCASFSKFEAGQWVRIELWEGAFGIPWWRWPR